MICMIMMMLHPPKSLLSILMGAILVPVVLAEVASAKNDLLPVPQTPSIDRMGGTLRSPLLLAQQSNFASFFEEGRLLSENQLRRQPPDPTLPVDQNSQFWQPIIFRSGGFSFWMPPGTLTQETVVLPTRFGNVSFRAVAANSANSRYVVGYAEQLTPEQLKNPQFMLVAIANKVVPSQKFTLVRNQAVTQGGIQGRELTYQSDTEVIVFRAFLRGNSGYVIGARSPKSAGVPSRQTTLFLNSFEFLS
ncbi:hypothetical protein [Leptodesmis sichuanensis]|uniref:hypothetical protein n=1 Tax=Leptodesmis sichuanensis TaxID=2906798 RepID=UPI001F19E9AE|nr:hypothetical protein [Leptodesmis sichuanensis]UIE39073.1 hypothetical protein KIK02_05620 [Leptodesmis sichuanensis A121]